MLVLQYFVVLCCFGMLWIHASGFAAIWQVKKIPKGDDPWDIKGRAVLFVDEDILDSE
jgi:hypothetical protein